MKAIALIPGTTTLQLVDRPEPIITAPDDVKVRVLRVGICGTPRHAYSDFAAALGQHPSDEIKAVIEWTTG